MEIVAVPNVRTDVSNIKRNAELLRRMLERRGMTPEVWDTPSTPVLYGQRLVPGASRTILFCIHWRIYARSAGDDKGPIQAFVSAMDAIDGKPIANVKVILYGEEEGGGPALDFVVGAARG